ncbi:charged multivesicular body protein 1b-like [Onthophagus taurus]|uniref:charged multivesicular body protein 1b-like n=1 Tax=Onthophagus taurus TaxID=166361 RepID=UPI000C2034BC|nr:charged multivesicular body protein 1b-like [Onthophagus taurus]
MAMTMESHLYNLKIAAKQLQRNSVKCEKEEKVEKLKTKKAIQKGNMDIARIHAENAIRQKNQAVNFLRMSARVDAVANRVESALMTRKVSRSMSGVVKSLDTAIKTNNLERISALMDTFDRQFEEMDVQGSVIESEMGRSTTISTPEYEVNALIREVADEAGLEYRLEFVPAPPGASIGELESVDEDELSQRLAKLRNSGR